MKTVRITAMATAGTLLFSIAWLVYVASNAMRPIDPPPIPGASPAEQRSEAVSRGFRLGREYRTTLLVSHGDSWAEAARRLEDGMPWDAVRDQWATRDRIWRDEPFDRLIQPELDRILGPADPDDPAHRRAAVLFLRAFAAGLKDRR